MKNILKTGFVAFVGALVGGALVWVIQGHSLSFIPTEMTYADLVASLLAVAALFLGVIGLIVAIVAIWGFKYFKQVAVASAKKAAHLKVSDELSAGSAKELIVLEARAVAQQRIEEEIRNGATRKYLDRKVNDAIAQALSENAIIGEELADERRVEAEKFRELDEQGGD